MFVNVPFPFPMTTVFVGMFGMFLSLYFRRILQLVAAGGNGENTVYVKKVSLFC